MSRSFPELPDRVDLDQLRRQAKELRNAARGGESAAVERIARHARSVEVPGEVSLAVAQLVIARELGFARWPKLKAIAESRAGLNNRAASFLAASVDGYAGRVGTGPQLPSRSVNDAPSPASFGRRGAQPVWRAPPSRPFGQLRLCSGGRLGLLDGLVRDMMRLGDTA